MNPEEKFQHFLSRVKNDESVYTGEPEHVSAVMRPTPTPQLRAWAIKIMESPMFYQGGLRGKKLPVAGKPWDKVLPISEFLRKPGIIPRNLALAVRRLPPGFNDVDLFTFEEREAVIEGCRKYAPL